MCVGEHSDNQGRLAVPVSSVVSAVLIWIAFNVDYAKRFWEWVTESMMNLSLKSETKRQKAEFRGLARASDSESSQVKDLEAQKLDSPAACVDQSGVLAKV